MSRIYKLTFIDSSGPAQLPAAEIDHKQPIFPVPDQSQPFDPTSADPHLTTSLSDIKPADHHVPRTIGSFDSPLDTFQFESTPVQQSDVTSEMEFQNTRNHQAPGSTVQDAEHTEVAYTSQHQGDDNNIESPTPGVSQSEPESVSSPMEVDSRSPSYSPVLERNIITASERDDDYEPPEATPPIAMLSTTGSPPFSPAPHEGVTEDVANDTLIQANGQVAPSQNEVKFFPFIHIILFC